MMNLKAAWFDCLPLRGLLLAAAVAFFSSWPVKAQNSVDTATVTMTQVRCGDSHVVVQNASPVEREDVCRGALDALEFLSESGFPLDFDLVVELSLQTPVEAYESASAGAYRRADRRVLVLGHEAFFELETFLGQPCDRALFRTVIAHEIAHAVSDRYFATEQPSHRAQEYIAAVVALATMDKVHLQRLLDDMNLPGFAEASEISLLFYLISPAGFMVKSYRHFLLPENGASFLAAVLAGEVLQYDDQMY